MLAVAFGVDPDHADYPSLKDEFFLHYERCMMDHTGPFDGVAHLVADLSRRGLAWGVVTNKSARFTDPLTRAMPLFANASVVISGDTTPHAKPHPAPLFEAARRRIAPAHCVYVGDDERDIVAGLAAGMVDGGRHLWIPRGQGRHQLAVGGACGIENLRWRY
jgi:phosphoglycolate phosphatase-like HAD superfamily hydrolase